jgi:hypothetical protein
MTEYKVAPTAEEQWMCQNQLVQRDDYASFSVLGVALILVIGGLIIVVQLMLNPVTNFYHRRLHGGSDTEKRRMPAFNAAHVLQIQRLAFEGQSPHIQWQMSRPEDLIPVTREGSILEFPGLPLHAASALNPGISHEALSKEGYNKLHQTPSASQSSQDELQKQPKWHERSVSYSRPFTHDRPMGDGQQASVMDRGQGARVD